jgi:hypothetical protein
MSQPKFIVIDGKRYKAPRKNNTVVIEVSRGMAHVSKCPAGLSVEIIDHDDKRGAP